VGISLGRYLIDGIDGLRNFFIRGSKEQQELFSKIWGSPRNTNLIAGREAWYKIWEEMLVVANEALDGPQ